MKTFIINLERDVARREHMIAQMTAVGMHFEWVRGIHGPSMPASARAEHYDDKLARWRCGRGLTPSEFGCSLSHIKTYRTIVRREIHQALILEDDIHVPALLPSLISELERVLPTDRRLVCLLSDAEIVEGSEHTPMLGGRFALAQFRAGHFGSSYIVTKSAAEAMADALYPVADVSDRWERLQRLGVVEFWVVRPAVMTQDQETFGKSAAPEVAKLFGDDRLALPMYRMRRARNLVWDEILILARRVLPMPPRQPSRTHGADRLIDWPPGVAVPSESASG